MSKFWVTRLTSVAGSSPSSLSAANTSYSLPKPQLPMFLPAKSAGSVIAGVGERHLQGARALEGLGDVHDVGARLPRGQCLRHPGDGEVDGAVGELLLGRDVRRVLDQLDLQAAVGEESLVVSGEVAGELRLRHPLQLQLDRVGALALLARWRLGSTRSGGRGRRVRRRIGRRRIGAGRRVGARTARPWHVGVSVASGAASSSSSPHAAATIVNAATPAASSRRPGVFLMLFLPRGWRPCGVW